MHVSLKWCYVIREKKKSKDKPNRRERAQAHNINWRDVQTKNVVNNVDMSCLRQPWQNGPYKN